MNFNFFFFFPVKRFNKTILKYEINQWQNLEHLKTFCMRAYFAHLNFLQKNVYFKLLLCLYQKRVPKNNETNSKVKRPLWEQRTMFVTRIKIVWKEQLMMTCGDTKKASNTYWNLGPYGPTHLNLVGALAPSATMAGITSEVK